MICIASDHAATDLKAEIVTHLEAAGCEIEDLGTSGTASVDYPDFAHRVANRVMVNQKPSVFWSAALGLECRWRRIGIPAYELPCAKTRSRRRMARRHNDANVLCIGARVVGVGVALQIVDIFLKSPFEGDRHLQRVQKIELSVEER